MMITGKIPGAATLLVTCLFLGAGVAQAEDQATVIEMKDGIVTPNTVTLPANAPVTIVVRNTGTTAAEFESKRLHQEQVVAVGGEVTIKLPALPAGDYAFVDEFHEQLETAKGVITIK